MKAEHIFDKKDWPQGPWQNEYDKMSWIDKNTSYPCVVRRNLFGALTGFAGLDEHNRLFQLEIEDRIYKSFITHGGVKYTGYSLSDDETFSPPKRLWWVGFYCTTLADICPRLDPDLLKKTDNAVYRSLPFAIQETTLLAIQLAKYDTRIFEENNHIDILIDEQLDNDTFH